LADRRIRSETVAVIGLGRFGGQVAQSLAKLGCEVLAVDSDMRVVDQWADVLNQVV
jgi:trk system potassium uptake protein